MKLQQVGKSYIKAIKRLLIKVFLVFLTPKWKTDSREITGLQVWGHSEKQKVCLPARFSCHKKVPMLSPLLLWLRNLFCHPDHAPTARQAKSSLEGGWDAVFVQEAPMALWGKTSANANLLETSASILPRKGRKMQTRSLQLQNSFIIWTVHTYNENKHFN